eukprot:3684754-Pyramimonas_sp.AAC.1
MVALIRRCETRAALIRALFGRCPQSWLERHPGRALDAACMFEFLREDADEGLLRACRRSLPRPLRGPYDAAV